MMILENLDEDTLYEVLVSSKGADDSFNIKPFGITYSDGNIVLNLYPNQTLFNIKNDDKFGVHFTGDVLLYTESFFGMLHEDSLDLMDCSVYCDVADSVTHEVSDVYGKNIITTIIAKPTKIIEHRKITTIINRATNKIIELLIDFSRYDYMDMHARNEFAKKLESTEKYIQKNGNKKHKIALKKIKERINPHD